jgi:hypothetical protein
MPWQNLLPPSLAWVAEGFSKTLITVYQTTRRYVHSHQTRVSLVSVSCITNWPSVYVSGMCLLMYLDKVTGSDGNALHFALPSVAHIRFLYVRMSPGWPAGTKWLLTLSYSVVTNELCEQAVTKTRMVWMNTIHNNVQYSSVFTVFCVLMQWNVSTANPSWPCVSYNEMKVHKKTYQLTLLSNIL